MKNLTLSLKLITNYCCLFTLIFIYTPQKVEANDYKYNTKKQERAQKRVERILNKSIKKASKKKTLMADYIEVFERGYDKKTKRFEKEMRRALKGKSQKEVKREIIKKLADTKYGEEITQQVKEKDFNINTNIIDVYFSKEEVQKRKDQQLSSLLKYTYLVDYLLDKKKELLNLDYKVSFLSKNIKRSPAYFDYPLLISVVVAVIGVLAVITGLVALIVGASFALVLILAGIGAIVLPFFFWGVIYQNLA